MNKAAMIFPGHISEELQEELKPNIVFYDAVLDEAVKVAVECEKQEFDVIISRAGSADVIKKAVSVPVVNCEVTHSDLIDSILHIKHNFAPDLEEIGLVNYGNVSYNVEHLEELTKVKVRQSWYWLGAEDLKARVLEYKRAGIKVVLGASLTVGFAQEVGLQGYLMQIGRETLQQAILKATEILAIRQTDRKYTEKVKNMLAFAHEGILFVDEKKRIDYANPRALQMLGKDKAELAGQHVDELFGEDGVAVQLNKIVKVFENQIIFNRAPVHVKQKKVGEVITFTETEQIQKVEEKIRHYLHDKGFVAKYKLDDIIAVSTPIKEALAQAKIYAKTDATVLITGQTGTGKEFFAHGIHEASMRREHPFLAINCAALPENLLESELFGYTEGAFTGARKGGKAGYFELAHRGTLFLDEIGELRPALQGKLLRAIQEKEVMRVGGDRIIPVDTRIIAATNMDLLEAVKLKEFRSDLYYRLNVLKINLPPLKQRSEDVFVLAKHFIEKFSAEHKSKISALSERLKATMASYDWPGNVRELECFINRYCLLRDELGENVLMAELQNNALEQKDAGQGQFLLNMGTMDEMLDEIYSKVYQSTGYNKVQTAKMLGVNRITVAKWLDKNK